MPLRVTFYCDMVEVCAFLQDKDQKMTKKLQLFTNGIRLHNQIDVRFNVLSMLGLLTGKYEDAYQMLGFPEFS
jgi:hypothetical protein